MRLLHHRLHRLTVAPRLPGFGLGVIHDWFTPTAMLPRSDTTKPFSDLSDRGSIWRQKLRSASIEERQYCALWRQTSTLSTRSPQLLWRYRPTEICTTACLVLPRSNLYLRNHKM